MIASKNNLKLLKLIVPAFLKHSLLYLNHVLPVDPQHTRIHHCLAYLSPYLLRSELTVFVLFGFEQYFLADSPSYCQVLPQLYL